MGRAPNGEIEQLQQINKRFNEQLEKHEAGLLEQGHIYDLGYPQAILLSTGIPKLPIRLSAKTLNIKSHDKQHGYALKELRRLVLRLSRIRMARLGRAFPRPDLLLRSVFVIFAR